MGTADGITEAGIRAHMEFLAGDALNGRGSNSRDEWIAAAYIAAQFRQWGLDPMGDAGGFVQAAEILREQMAAPAVLSSGAAQFTHGQEMLVSTLTGAHVAGPLVKNGRGRDVSARRIGRLDAGSRGNWRRGRGRTRSWHTSDGWCGVPDFIGDRPDRRTVGDCGRSGHQCGLTFCHCPADTESGARGADLGQQGDV